MVSEPFRGLVRSCRQAYDELKSLPFLLRVESFKLSETRLALGSTAFARVKDLIFTFPEPNDIFDYIAHFASFLSVAEIGTQLPRLSKLTLIGTEKHHLEAVHTALYDLCRSVTLSHPSLQDMTCIEAGDRTVKFEITILTPASPRRMAQLS